MLLHDTLQNRYEFAGFLVMETALHIGTGQSSLTTDAGVIRDYQGYVSTMPYTKEAKIVGREGDKVVLFYSLVSVPVVSDRDYTIRTALLPEFGGMGIGAMDFIRLLIRKLTFDRIRFTCRFRSGALTRWIAGHEWSIRSGRIRDPQRCVKGAVTNWRCQVHRREEIS